MLCCRGVCYHWRFQAESPNVQSERRCIAERSNRGPSVSCAKWSMKLVFPRCTSISFCELMEQAAHISPWFHKGGLLYLPWVVCRINGAAARQGRCEWDLLCCVGESLWVLCSEPGRSQQAGGGRAPPAQTRSSSQGLIYGQVSASASAHGSPLCSEKWCSCLCHLTATCPFCIAI